MYKRILVPLDGSELAERILPHVKAIAKGTETEVLLLRAVAAPVIGPPAIASPAEAKKWIEDERAQAAKYLEGVAKRLKDEGLKTKVEVLQGDAAVEALMAAEQQNEDLITMMTHGATGAQVLRPGQRR